MFDDINKALKFMRLAAEFAPGIKHLIVAGEPVMEAVDKQSPELGAAIREIAAVAVKQAGAKSAAASVPAPECPHPEGPAAVIAKTVFAPERVTPAEKNYMDRASSGTGA